MQCYLQNTLLVSGSASLTNHKLVNFIEKLGEKIIEDSNFILVTGGLKHIKERGVSVDHIVVEGAKKKLKELGIDPSQRIITFLPEREWEKITRFEEGKTITVKNSGLKSRRYFMVHDCDAMITIEGHKATKDNIDLAWILQKPVLPLPFTGGNSQERWGKYNEKNNELIHQLNIDEKKELPLIESEEIDIDHISELCIKIIKRNLKPKCFIAMPFENHPLEGVYDAISQKVEKLGYKAIRVDKTPFSGSIIDAIWDLIRASDFLIADITNYNSNVFYEMGISHSFGKKTIIILYDEQEKVPSNIPFDIRVEKISPFNSIESLIKLLDDLI